MVVKNHKDALSTTSSAKAKELVNAGEIEFRTWRE